MNNWWVPELKYWLSKLSLRIFPWIDPNLARSYPSFCFCQQALIHSSDQSELKQVNKHSLMLKSQLDTVTEIVTCALLNYDLNRRFSFESFHFSIEFAIVWVLNKTFMHKAFLGLQYLLTRHTNIVSNTGKLHLEGCVNTPTGFTPLLYIWKPLKMQWTL